MEWNTAEVGLGEQQGRNSGSQVNCSDTNWLFVFFSQTIYNCTKSGLGMFYVMNVPFRIKCQQNTMFEVFFYLFQFRNFFVLLLGVLIPAKLWEIMITLCSSSHSSHLQLGLELRDYSMRIMLKKIGGCHKIDITMMKKLNGLLYEDVLRQLKKVTKSCPNWKRIITHLEVTRECCKLDISRT